MTEPRRLELDLSDTSSRWLAMQILNDKALVYRNGEPTEFHFPEGCIGMMLVFDTEEAAKKFFGDNVLLTKLNRA
jgi:hypothetical protein